MTRRQIASYTFVGAGCLFASVASIKSRGVLVGPFDAVGVLLGVALLAVVAIDLWKSTSN